MGRRAESRAAQQADHANINKLALSGDGEVSGCIHALGQELGASRAARGWEPQPTQHSLGLDSIDNTTLPGKRHNVTY